MARGSFEGCTQRIPERIFILNQSRTFRALLTAQGLNWATSEKLVIRMAIFLLAVIAVGVLLLSDAGRAILMALFAIVWWLLFFAIVLVIISAVLAGIWYIVSRLPLPQYIINMFMVALLSIVAVLLLSPLVTLIDRWRSRYIAEKKS
jgi:hypothetical protein